MPGPPPKHPSARARRNNPKSDFRVLPTRGRTGKAPAWPLQPDVAKTARLEVARDKVAELQVKLEEATDGRTKGRLRRQIDQNEMQVATLSLQLEQEKDAEVELWNELWKTPQALIWDEARAHREVAQYVRWKVRGEQGDLDAAKEARMLSDRLGLNPLALLRMRAEIERVDEAETTGRKRRTTAAPKGKPKGDDEDPRGGLYAVS
jgi:hypothetical protein